MRAQSWILIIIALGCGLVASIGISQVMDRGETGEGVAIEMEDIFVAIVDIPIGDPITSQMIKLDKWPKDKIPEGVITKLEDVEKRRPRSRIYKGEPILATKLIGADEKGPELPAGYRAVAIKVTPEDIIGGLVKPGDRVDLLVFLEKGVGSNNNSGNETQNAMIKTFLRDVRIFAIDASFERDQGKEGKAVQAKTITLEVKPQDGEKIMLAQHIGKIRLVLRGSNDIKGEDENDDGTDLGDLTQTKTNRGNSAPVVAAPLGPSPAAVDPTALLDILKSSTQTVADPTKPAAAIVEEKPPMRTVVLSGPAMDVYEMRPGQMASLVYSTPNLAVAGQRPAGVPAPLTHDNPGSNGDQPAPPQPEGKPARE